jgi:hypothetical protein
MPAYESGSRPTDRLLQTVETSNLGSHADSPRLGPPLLFSCAAGVGSLLFGFSMGFTSPCIDPITAEYRWVITRLSLGFGLAGLAARMCRRTNARVRAHLRTQARRFPVFVWRSMSDSQKSLFSSVVNIGAMVGCILCLVTSVLDRLGREKTIAIGCVFFLVGSAPFKSYIYSDSRPDLTKFSRS